jgi:hypothetical protein
VNGKKDGQRSEYTFNPKVSWGNVCFYLTIMNFHVNKGIEENDINDKK